MKGLYVDVPGSKEEIITLRDNFIEPIKDVLSKVKLQTVIFIYKNIYKSLTMLITITKQCVSDIISIIDLLSGSCKCFCVKLDQFISELNQGVLNGFLQTTNVCIRHDLDICFIPEVSCSYSFYKRVNIGNQLYVPDPTNRINYKLFKDHKKETNYTNQFNDRKFPNTKFETIELLADIPFML